MASQYGSSFFFHHFSKWNDSMRIKNKIQRIEKYKVSEVHVVWAETRNKIHFLPGTCLHEISTNLFFLYFFLQFFRNHSETLENQHDFEIYPHVSWDFFPENIQIFHKLQIYGTRIFFPSFTLLSTFPKNIHVWFHSKRALWGYMWNIKTIFQ